MKFACEVINDNGKYYANMTIGGYTVEGLFHIMNCEIQ